MPGFIAHIGNSDIKLPKEKRHKLVVNSISSEKYQVERRVVNKFMNDRLFADLDDYLVVVEGVVLNNHELEKQYKTSSWLDCVIEMYKINGDDFFKDFRGSFSGLFYDKKQDKWLIYTNHIGDKQVFLYKIADDEYIFASEIGFIVDTLKSNGFSVSLNKTGAYFALTHGFVIEDKTLVQGVSKLIAGTYYKLDNGELTEVTYHRFSNTPREMSVKEAIEGIEKYFTKAVRLQFEKDKEYGYKHITCLSGGLDSRMTVMVAHELGYTQQLNTTFSQSNYLDFTVPQQIATDLHHDFIFKSLDGGDFMDKIDEITPITYGSTCYFGISHGKSLYDNINFEPYGLIHTGMIGDAIIGTFFKKNEYNKEYKLGQGAYSLEVIERLQNYSFKEEYENEEIFCLYTRAFTGANQGQTYFQEVTESVSPFCDVDFIEFCYSIPLNLRYNHKIYFDWIFAKHPKAADYIWEKIKCKISRFDNQEVRRMSVFGKKIPHYKSKEFLKWLSGSIKRRLGLRKKGNNQKTMVVSTKDHMNPVDYWYETNPYIRNFMQNYWEENQHYITDEQLRNDMQHLFMDCVLLDKLQALSVLSTIKLINS